MAKSDKPLLRMVVENGKLSPRHAYDAECLNSYKNRAEVLVHITEERDRVLVRKWWAVIGKAVKECKTPWENSNQASEAIKLALDITDLSKTVTGQFMIFPKSLSDLSGPELEDAVERMMQLLYKITGVDPDTFKREIADIGEEQNSSSDVSSPADDESGAVSAAAGDAGLMAPGVPENSTNDHTSERTKIDSMLMEECIDNMLRDAVSEPADKRVEKINKLEEVFGLPENLGRHKDFVRVCAETARRIVGKPKEKEQARKYLLGRIGKNG